MTDTRAIVLEILIENEKNGTFISLLIKDVLDKYAYLDRRDRAFIKTLAEGTVENRIALDYCIDTVSSVMTEKMKPVVRNIIRMAAYQIMYMDHVPDSAACNEAVKEAKLKHMGSLSGFVNGVTRGISRNKKEFKFKDIETEYSCPKWIAGMFRRDYGEETAEKMIRSLGVYPRLFARPNSSKITRDELIALLGSEGISSEMVPLFDEAVMIDGDFSPGSSEAFRKGLFSIQDLSSMTVVPALEIKKGMCVFDICAAPGGKALHAAELLDGTGRVVAFDVSAAKTMRIDENIRRLGAGNIESRVQDAREFIPEYEGRADRIIADLPCSGLGVMNRKPDLRYRVKYEDIASLQLLQRQILGNAVGYLKNGGKMVFSVCTVTKEETVEQSVFIENELHLKRISERQYLQGIDPCDGFYMAVFEKE